MSKIIPIKCKGAINLKLSDIHEFQGELKTLSKDRYEQLKKSILTLGFSFPENVWLDPEDKKYKILDGHQRFRTVKQMAKEGYAVDNLPCNLVEADNKKQAKQKLLAAASQYGEVTSEGLYEFINEADLKIEDVVADFNFPEIDFEEFEEEFFDGEGAGLNGADEDAIPENVPAKTKLGDLYQLGEHRLLCGDSTDVLQVERLMGGEKADMVFTDPPYGMNLDVEFDKMFKDEGHNNTGKRFDKIKGDDKDYDPNPIFTVIAKDYFIWGADYFYDRLPPKGSLIAWDKRDEQLDKVPGNPTEFCWSKNPKRRMTCRIKWSGHHGMQKDDTKKRVHPTQKPTALAEWFFERWGKDAKTIVDIYGGSGSTLIACEKTKRKCFMMELDPHYCDVIVSRWETFTGKKAKLIK